MTAKNKKKKKEDAPLITPRFLGFLVLVALATGFGTFLYQKPSKKYDPHQGNPNVVKLRPIPKDQFKGYKMTAEQTYMEDVVFKYIAKHQTPVKDCYFGFKGKFKVNPKGYKVVIRFTVPQSGKPKDFGLVLNRTQLKVKPILECILKQASKWQFKPHKMKKPLTMRFPFFFR